MTVILGLIPRIYGFSGLKFQASFAFDRPYYKLQQILGTSPRMTTPAKTGL